MLITFDIPDDKLEVLKDIEGEDDPVKAVMCAIQFSIDNF
jgi:hypothetical protein